MPAQSNIEIEIHSPTIFSVTLTGEHDVLSRRPLARMTVGRIYRYVLVDLTACTFLDSTMINALLAAAKGHVARGRRGRARRADRRQSGATYARDCECAETLPFHETRSAGIEDSHAASDREYAPLATCSVRSAPMPEESPTRAGGGHSCCARRWKPSAPRPPQPPRGLDAAGRSERAFPLPAFDGCRTGHLTASETTFATEETEHAPDLERNDHRRARWSGCRTCAGGAQGDVRRCSARSP